MRKNNNWSVVQLVLGIDAIGAIKCNDLKVPLDLEQSEMNSMFG